MSAFELKIQHQKDFILLSWILKIVELETFFLEINDILIRICHY
jgi:hypothetical protein